MVAEPDRAAKRHLWLWISGRIQPKILKVAEPNEATFGIFGRPKTESLKWLAEPGTFGEVPFMAFGRPWAPPPSPRTVRRSLPRHRTTAAPGILRSSHPPGWLLTQTPSATPPRTSSNGPGLRLFIAPSGHLLISPATGYPPAQGLPGSHFKIHKSYIMHLRYR